MKHNGHLMEVQTDTKSLTDVLMPAQTPQIWGVTPIAHADDHRTYIQGSIQMCGGVRHMGRHPNAWRVFKHKEGPLRPTITCRNILEHTDAMGSIGDIWEHQGVSEHTVGVQMYGASKYTGGVQTPPKYETCLPLRKSRKKLFKAEFLHIRSWK